MRPSPWLEVEKYRRPDIPGYRSRPGDPYGAFEVEYRGVTLWCIVTDGDYKSCGLPQEYAWEHVSVSTKNRVPNWYELEFIKKLFWADDEVVMQLHLPASDHINIHKHCLHLWRPLFCEIPLPPRGAV